MLHIPVTLESPPESSEEEYSTEVSDSREDNDNLYSEDDLTDDEAEDDYSDVEYEAATQSVVSKAHLNYFYGDITREETEQMLVEHDTPGSFLVRQNDDTFKLSWMSFQRKLY